MRCSIERIFRVSNDIWDRGFYELSIEVASHSEEHLDTVIRALWRDCNLEGGYASADIEPEEQMRVTPGYAAMKKHGLFGVATLPEGTQVVCGTRFLRTIDEESQKTIRIWLGIFIPIGVLALVYDIGEYPFRAGISSRFWRAPLDEWLVRIARTVDTVAPFRLAKIGFEASGGADREKFAESGIPVERCDGYLWRTTEEEELLWYLPTDYDG